MIKLPIYEELKKEILSCQKCDLCIEGKIDKLQAQVMGQGNLNADVMFIAQNPGENEVKNSQPLTSTGVSGKLYEQVLDYLGLTRDEVFTTNTVACHSPNNRDPEIWELNKCREYLQKQIDLVQPKLIVTFGRFAAQVFINKIKITQDHGKLHKSADYNVEVFPLAHPAYIKAYAPHTQREAFKKDIIKLRSIIDKIKKEKNE